ncbi:hypothetical protein EJ06DRAFT_519764 [Trichodelitschia bisporula]|uniref:Helix-turn-helix domain-containing protein n=1 Tax=Trichodelitschia bisporula TaxID=703511 RepID=A0A6G1I3V9_9PEZI|nr:hypothetical protein EJ06DRAFT_519764 [Trichodelitschia bisporula]
MGAATSKTARAATATARKYPAAASPTTRAAAPPARPPPEAVDTVPAPARQAPAVTEKSTVIDLDGREPAYADKLRRLGPVQTPSMQSHSSLHPSDPRSQDVMSDAEFFPDREGAAFRSNPAVMTLLARQELQRRADEEMENVGRKGFKGRTFLDAKMIKEVLVLRMKGVEPGEIERRLELREGVVEGLGSGRVVEPV